MSYAINNSFHIKNNKNTVRKRKSAQYEEYENSPEESEREPE